MVAEVARRTGRVTRIPKTRAKQQLQAESRRKEVIRMTANNMPLTEQAKQLGVSYITVRRDRKALMEQARTETLNEMQLYREDQLSRISDKWDEIESDDSMTGAEKHLAWSRWMKLEMDLRGTAAPSKSISASVNVEQQAIPIEQQLEYLTAFAGLYEDERLEELDRVKARKRTCRVVMEGGGPSTKLLPESGS
jgi:hypothetical protein